jgi:hypothetical protein
MRWAKLVGDACDSAIMLGGALDDNSDNCLNIDCWHKYF